jgi:hypothetical protein
MTDGGPNIVENGSTETSTPGRSEILFDVRALVSGLWRGRWIILLCALIGFGLGARKLRNFSPKYEATTIVSPTSGGQAAPQISGVSKVARSLGVQLPSQGGGSRLFDRLKITISSVELARQLDSEQDMLRRIFAGSWDAETQSWRKPSGWKFELEQKFSRAIHLPTWRAPSIESFAMFLGSSIAFKEFQEMPFVRISYANEDPEMARWVLTKVLSGTDRILRDSDQGESKFRLKYLKRQFADTAVHEHQTMFMSMIANEERRLMLLRSDRPYALETITPIFVSNVPTSPNIVKDFGVLFVGWIISGIAIVMVITLVREV